MASTISFYFNPSILSLNTSWQRSGNCSMTRHSRCDFLVKTEIYSKIPADIFKDYRCPKSKPQNAINQLGKFRVYLREKVARNGGLLLVKPIFQKPKAHWKMLVELIPLLCGI